MRELVLLKEKSKTYLPTAIETEIYPHIEDSIMQLVAGKLKDKVSFLTEKLVSTKLLETRMFTINSKFAEIKE